MATLALENKSIVIVGGTSGLGLSAARAFLAAGARIVIVGRDPSKVEAALVDAEVVGERFSVALLIAAAELFRKELPFSDVGGNLGPPGNWARTLAAASCREARSKNKCASVIETSSTAGAAGSGGERATNREYLANPFSGLGEL